MVLAHAGFYNLWVAEGASDDHVFSPGDGDAWDPAPEFLQLVDRAAEVPILLAAVDRVRYLKPKG